MSAKTLARPECDGATRNGTRNCNRWAAWKIKAPDDRDYVSAACSSHLNQVCADLLAGEAGELEIRRIVVDER